MRSSKKISFWIILVLITVSFLEITLHGICWISQKADILFSKGKNQQLLLITDEKLGVRGNPAYPDHDIRGFRNLKRPAVGTVDIISMGDSQTYGYGVGSNDSWPVQLGKLTHQEVYNMAIESSGPVQSFLMFNEVLELKPKHILVTIYLGNDLYDSYEAAYTKALATSLRTTDQGILQNILDTEKTESLIDKVKVQGAIAYQDERYHDMPGKSFLEEYSNLYGLWTVAKRTFTENGEEDWQAIEEEALKTKDFRQFYNNEKVRTVFTPAYRLLAVNLDDARIKEGLRITLEAIRLMKLKARAAGIKFTVVLIPTKELAYQSLVAGEKEKFIVQYQKQVETEEMILQKIKTFLLSQEIDSVDVLPGMQQRLGKGLALYHSNWDGHPHAKGYRAIAEIISEHLTEGN